MMMGGMGWPTDNVWTFPIPITNLDYCNVIYTEVIDVTEDDDPSGPSPAVYFYE